MLPPLSLSATLPLALTLPRVILPLLSVTLSVLPLPLELRLPALRLPLPAARVMLPALMPELMARLPAASRFTALRPLSPPDSEPRVILPLPLVTTLIELPWALRLPVLMPPLLAASTISPSAVALPMPIWPPWSVMLMPEPLLLRSPLAMAPPLLSNCRPPTTLTAPSVMPLCADTSRASVELTLPRVTLPPLEVNWLAPAPPGVRESAVTSPVLMLPEACARTTSTEILPVLIEPPLALRLRAEVLAPGAVATLPSTILPLVEVTDMSLPGPSIPSWLSLLMSPALTLAPLMLSAAKSPLLPNTIGPLTTVAPLLAMVTLEIALTPPMLTPPPLFCTLTVPLVASSEPALRLPPPALRLMLPALTVPPPRVSAPPELTLTRLSGASDEPPDRLPSTILAPLPLELTVMVAPPKLAARLPAWMPPPLSPSMMLPSALRLPSVTTPLASLMLSVVS